MLAGASGGDAGAGGCTGRGGGITRGPQSVQSVPRLQDANSAPGPPSSQPPSEAKLHVSVQPAPGDAGGDDAAAGGGSDGGGSAGGGVCELKTRRL